MILVGLALATSARGADPLPELPPLRAPIKELDHPSYLDAAGTPVTWATVRDLARPTDALGDVRRRRLGRTLVRTMFLTATAAEVWGTVQFIEDRDRAASWLLGAQTALTGLCAVLSFTSAPKDWVEDRAIVLRGANQAMLRR